MVMNVSFACFASRPQVMFFILSKILSFITYPLTWVVAVALYAAFIKDLKRARKIFIASLLLLLFFTNPFIINQLVHAWEVRSYSQKQIDTPYAVGVVMGGSLKFYNSEVGRIVYSSSVDRLLQAVDLYRSNKIGKIFLSGGSGFVNFQNIKEASLLKTTLLNMQIPDSDIVIENESRNTYENAANSAKILKANFAGKKILIITSAIHIRRTKACFVKASIDADYFPVDERSGVGIYTMDKLIIPNIDSMQAWEQLIHECVGMLVYKIQGYA